MPTGYKTLTNPPVPDDLPSGQHMFLNSINCESATRHFQPREGPSRGLLRDCEIFANLCLKLYLSDSRDQCGSPALEKTGTMTNAKVQTQN